MRLSSLLVVAVTMFALYFSGEAYADEAGDKALAAMDAATNKPQSQYFEYEATTTAAGKTDLKANLNVWIKREKFLVEFSSPDYLNGVKTLKTSPTDEQTNLQIFDGLFDGLLPNRNRKASVPIPADKVDQTGFLLAVAQSFYPEKRAAQYAATVSGNKLTLTPNPKPKAPAQDNGLEVSLFGAKLSVSAPAAPKAEEPKAASKIEITLLMDKLVPSEINVYDADGKLELTETFSDYTNGDEDNKDVWAATTINVVLHGKYLAATFTRKNWKLNLPISDSTFKASSLTP